MLDYSSADFGAYDPEPDTTTHVCGCHQCEECVGDWAPDLAAARTTDEQAAVWMQIQAASSPEATADDLPF